MTKGNVMPRNFTITTPSETVRIGADGRAEMIFTVTNVSRFPTRGMAKLTAQGNLSATWLTLAVVEREFPAGGAQQFLVAANVPAGTPPGRYTWRFDMVSADKSGEGIDLGPTVVFEVGPQGPEKKPEKEKKRGPWRWVALGCVLGFVAFPVLLLGYCYLVQNN